VECTTVAEIEGLFLTVRLKYSYICRRATCFRTSWRPIKTAIGSSSIDTYQFVRAAAARVCIAEGHRKFERWTRPNEHGNIVRCDPPPSGESLDWACRPRGYLARQTGLQPHTGRATTATVRGRSHETPHESCNDKAEGKPHM